MKTPLIFDIERSSLNNGAGIRTTIYFKGCNLNCYWCHNPESKSAFEQTAFFKDKCISCGACKSPHFTTDICPASARKIYGKVYTVKELYEIIAKDKAYYTATNGGVTFSGGECMLYPEFISEIAQICYTNGISVAVDTAGNVPFEHFEKVLPYVSVFLYDIKAIDPILHKKGTGYDNKLILENLEKLLKTDKEIIIRVPVIPDFNDGEELISIKEYCNDRKLRVELLPYHSMGIAKKEALNK